MAHALIAHMPKLLILVLCIGNSCRSQMAEYFLRAAVGDLAEVGSAGCEPAGYVHPLAIQVMREKGYDLTVAESQPAEDFMTRDVDVVVTVCGYADQACAQFSGQKKHYCWKPSLCQRLFAEAVFNGESFTPRNSKSERKSQRR